MLFKNISILGEDACQFFFQAHGIIFKELLSGNNTLIVIVNNELMQVQKMEYV